ncbi:uncharacterized protein ACBT57_005065 isoform 2-T4 [Dama dama]
MEPHRWGASGGGQRVRRSPSSRAATAQFLEPVPCAWHSSRLWDTAANQRSRYPSLVMVSDNKQDAQNSGKLESRDGRDPLRANIAVCYNGLVKTRTSDDAAIQQWLEIEDPKACQKRNRIPKSLCKSRSSVYCFHIFGDISETLS